jgi:rhodanese-related sulfurtransferase
MAQLIEFAGNHPILAGAIIVVAVLVVVNEARIRMRGVFAVTPFDAVRLVNQGAAIVDLRGEDLYGTSHLADSANVTQDDLASHVAAIKAKKAVLLVCDNGSMSGRCAAAIRKAGRDHVFSLKGGLAAWQQENLPTVSQPEATGD